MDERLNLEQTGHTWLQTARGGRPAHDGRDGAHHRAHPGVADAEPLEWRVATSVEEDVEGAQKARQGIDCQREQGHTRNSAGHGKGHGVEGADARRRDSGEQVRVTAH